MIQLEKKDCEHLTFSGFIDLEAAAVLKILPELDLKRKLFW
jgi:hypothetical protein